MQSSNTNPVRLAREAAGLSQVQLALRAKRSITTIRNAEQGLATTNTLAAIAKALGVEVYRLRPTTLPLEAPVASRAVAAEATGRGKVAP